MPGKIRRKLLAVARAMHRGDLAALLDHPADEREQHAKTVAHVIDILRIARPAEPQITDEIAQWLAPRAARVLRAHGITTLADLTVRIPRRRQWWKAVPGLGAASARAIEQFFATWPALTEKARALVVASQRSDIAPWETLKLPHEVDGTKGTFRAPGAIHRLQSCSRRRDHRRRVRSHQRTPIGGLAVAGRALGVLTARISVVRKRSALRMRGRIGLRPSGLARDGIGSRQMVLELAQTDR
jgi:hypothetical protein